MRAAWNFCESAPRSLSTNIRSHHNSRLAWASASRKEGVAFSYQAFRCQAGRLPCTTRYQCQTNE